MKRIILSIILFSSFFIYAQDTNKIVIDENTKDKMLIGNCTRDAFEDTAFSKWYYEEYDNYKLDSLTLDNINVDFENYSIEIILGTWCPDSRREVPRLHKILDYLNFPDQKVKMICVNKEKKTEGDELKDLIIELVPTFIIYKNGEEIGRIVETPQQTLEEDLATIFME